jgi:hypothetical protein
MMHARALALAVVLAACSRGAAGPQSSPPPPPLPGGGPGPRVGETMPAFEAPDQSGARQSFESLRGPNGLLLNFNRSVVW